MKNIQQNSIKKTIIKVPLSDQKLIERFSTKYNLNETKQLNELILNKGYRRAKNIYKYIATRNVSLGMSRQISGSEIVKIYKFDKHYRNSIKEKFERIEIYLTNKYINYISREAFKINVIDYRLALFGTAFFKNNHEIRKCFASAYCRKHSISKDQIIIEQIHTKDLWEYMGSFTVGELRMIIKNTKTEWLKRFMKSINLNEDTSSFKRILETFNDLRNVISHAEQLISSNQIRTQKDLNEMTRGLTIHEKTTFLIMYSTPRKFSKEIEEMMKFKTNNKWVKNIYSFKEIKKRLLSQNENMWGEIW